MTRLHGMMIVADNLGKTYVSGGQPLEVLKDVDLMVEEDEILAVVGPSGSGKTTLLGLLAGLDEPTRGRVRLKGEDIFALTEDGRAEFRAQHVGFVFQTFHLLPSLTALENVLVPLELGRFAPGVRAIEERAAWLLDRVGLGDRLEHYPAQLSGGEQQRVALARAFANEPSILFADEPTGNLDQRTGATVIDLMEALNRESRTTLVLVTHDHMLAERAHRIIHLQDGRVVADDRVNPWLESRRPPESLDSQLAGEAAGEASRGPSRDPAGGPAGGSAQGSGRPEEIEG